MSRLAVALDVLPLAGDRTGVGRFCHGLAASLAGRGDVAVVPFALGRHARAELAGPVAELGLDPARTWPVPTSAATAWCSRASRPPAEWLCGDVDVVHGTNFVVPPTRAAARVVTVHDLTALRFPELCARSSLAYPKAVRRAAAGGAFVHTPSRFVADEVAERLGVDPARIRVVPHGIDPPTARGDHRAPASAPYVLALGAIEPRKDLPSLVAAFDRLAPDHPTLRLVLAGPPGWGAEAVLEAVRASAAAGRVELTGYVDEARRADLLAGASVLAYPSRYEGFGFPPLEAMAAGVPVVATAVGALPEVLGDAAVLVAPGDVDALAEAIAAVLAGGATRDALVAAGRARAAGSTWQACGEAMVALYREAAGASLPASGGGRR